MWFRSRPPTALKDDETGRPDLSETEAPKVYCEQVSLKHPSVSLKRRANGLALMPLHRRADPCPWPRRTIGEFAEEYLRNVVILVGTPAMEGDYQSPLPRVVAHRANIAGDNGCQMHTNTTLYSQTIADTARPL